MSRRAERLAIMGVVALAVVLRVGLVLAVYAQDAERVIVDDTPSYVEPARSILHDGEFDRSPGAAVPEYQRTPGYPLFVALVYGVSGESNTAVVAVQAALSGLVVFLAIVLARRLTDSLGVGLAVGALLALDPVQAAHSGFVVTETVATVLLTLAAYCGVRLVQSGWSTGWAAGFGLAIAAATYVRPTTYYFGLVVVGVAAIVTVVRQDDRPKLLRAGLAFLVPCVVLLGAWNVRNHNEVGSWRFSGIEGTNLYWYRAAGVVADRDGISFAEARAELTTELNRGHGPAAEVSRYENGKPPAVWQDRQGEYYDRARHAGLDILRSEPGLTVRQVGRGIYSQLVQAGWTQAFRYATGNSAPALIVAVGFVFVWGLELLAAVGMAASLRRPGRWRAADLLLVALLGYTILVSAGPEAASGFRFRIPIWPIWCLYAAIGWRAVVASRLGRRLRRSRWAGPADPGSEERPELAGAMPSSEAFSSVA